jgi:hypothetical protein
MMVTQDEIELSDLVVRLVRASEAKSARIAALEAAIESLAPGGGEFHGDADRCIEWVRARLSTTGHIATERNRLRRRVTTLEAALRGLLTATDATGTAPLMTLADEGGPFCICCAVYEVDGEIDHDDDCPVKIAERALEE